GYPSVTEEFVIVERMTGAVQAIQRVLDPEQLLALQQETANVYVDPAIIEYAVKLVNATRQPALVGEGELAPFVLFGASPRASINLILAGRAMAYMRGRAYALPQDVRDIATDVIRHRLVLSYEALADNVTADAILERILNAIPLPEVSFSDRNPFVRRSHA
ncbi:MAG: hypothetical protein KDE09_26340, partial [Anaerolineales bacterium]|nr:hypothetical protein [Anaerolineales bacterium]